MMRIALTALAATLALALPAQAQEPRQWGIYDAGDNVRLFYGVPDSGDVTLVFICDPKPKPMSIVTVLLPRNPKDGQRVRTTLSNGTITAAYDSRIAENEAEGAYGDAEAAADPKVLDVLRSGTAVTISIPGKRERVPLRGVAGPLAEFEAACFQRLQK
jgi:hypothetical protein